jgi:carbonic anhydrase
MDRSEVQAVLSRIEQQLAGVGGLDAVVAQAVEELLNLVERLVSGQHPFAAILGCADSRVPPEVLFDEGLGELFVIRQAGHVADDDSLASIEYAVHHLHVPLIVVLGHQACGAVSAALGVILRDEPVAGHIVRLVDDIAPAVMEVRNQGGDIVEAAVRAHTRLVVAKLHESRPIIHASEEHGEVRVVGAYYSFDTGEVEWLDR